MQALVDVDAVYGEWFGTNRLWFSPDEEPHVSSSGANVIFVAGARTLALRYTWEHENQVRDGMIWLRTVDGDGDVAVVWADAFHTGGDFMLCRRTPVAGALLAATGSYAAPPGPDWGWRIELYADRTDELRIIMYNIRPEGREDLAVEAVYTRNP
jgi:hypothetical protein